MTIYKDYCGFKFCKELPPEAFRPTSQRDFLVTRAKYRAKKKLEEYKNWRLNFGLQYLIFNEERNVYELYTIKEESYIRLKPYEIEKTRPHEEDMYVARCKQQFFDSIRKYLKDKTIYIIDK